MTKVNIRLMGILIIIILILVSISNLNSKNDNLREELLIIKSILEDIDDYVHEIEKKFDIDTLTHDLLKPQ